MDNDTLNPNPQTNTSTDTPSVELPEAPATPESPTTEPTPEAPAEPTLAASPAIESAPAEPASTDPITPEAPTNPTAEPAPETPAPEVVPEIASEATDSTPEPSTDSTPLVDPSLVNSAPAADPLSAASSPIPAVDATPLAEPPIVGTTPADKQSPILNSAPSSEKKFDLKYIIPIAVLGVLVLALGGYLIYDKLIGQPAALESARKTAAAAVTPTITNDVSIDTSDDDDTSDEPILIPFSSTGALNNTKTYLLATATSPAGVSITSNDAATVAEFTVNWAEAKTTFSDLRTSTGTTTYTIDFNQGVTEFFYGNIGNTGYYFFLLEDGTVDYLEIHSALLNRNFTAAGPITDVENVAKFMSATVDGTATVLAQTSTGDYYDLSTYLN